MSNTTGQNGYYPRIKEGHSKLAQVLLDREVIYSEDVEHIFGKRAGSPVPKRFWSCRKRLTERTKENADKEAKADATMENVTDTPTEENKTGENSLTKVKTFITK